MKLGTTGFIRALNTNLGLKFKMTDSIWRLEILKNVIYWWNFMKPGIKRFLRALYTNLGWKFQNLNK